jgi:hypothetical protein
MFNIKSLNEQVFQFVLPKLLGSSVALATDISRMKFEHDVLRNEPQKH